jgi:hypothetical protein
MHQLTGEDVEMQSANKSNGGKVVPGKQLEEYHNQTIIGIWSWRFFLRGEL